MSHDPASLSTTALHDTAGSSRATWFAYLQRPATGFALLVLFTILVSLLSQRLFSSIDEGYQWEAAQHPIAYIATHRVQDHPFYGVLVRIVIDYFPPLPIHPVRLPSFLAGLLVPPVFYLTHRRYAGHAAALLTAMVLVMMDPVRYYISVGRGYSLMLLAILVLNALVLGMLRRGGWWRPIVYVPVGVLAGFTHLWAYPVVGAHGAFVALEWWRRRFRGTVARRTFTMGVFTALTLALGILIHLPLLPEIRAVAGRKGGPSPMIVPIFNALLQIPRFASWTMAVHLILVPIVLEGLARRPIRLIRDRRMRMYLVTVVVLCAWASYVNSVYFGSRYLLGIVPAVAGLLARGLSAYWRVGEPRPGQTWPILPRPATWAIGLATGILCANAPIAHEIPCGATTGRDGRDSGYYLRNLARAIGDPAAVLILAAGLAALWWARRSRGRRDPTGPRKHDDLVLAWLWTTFVLASLIPVSLGGAFSPVLFELHNVAAAAVLLDAWEHRNRPRHLHALRYAMLAIGVIAILWQVGIEMPQFHRWTVVGLAIYVPAVLMVIPLVKSAAPEFAESDGRAS